MEGLVRAHTPVIPRKKLPLLALVDALPCCATLSRKSIPPSSKFLTSYPIVGWNHLKFEVGILTAQLEFKGSSCILVRLRIYGVLWHSVQFGCYLFLLGVELSLLWQFRVRYPIRYQLQNLILGLTLLIDLS